MYVCASGLWQDFWPIAVFCGCSGFFEGGFHGQRATVLSEMVPPPFLAMSVGYMIFCQGVGNLLGPVWAGTYGIYLNMKLCPNARNLHVHVHVDAI